MRFFVSSTRAGLAEERDALPGLLLAVDHDPVVYEGFGAQDVPAPNLTALRALRQRPAAPAAFPLARLGTALHEVVEEGAGSHVEGPATKSRVRMVGLTLPASSTPSP